MSKDNALSPSARFENDRNFAVLQAWLPDLEAVARDNQLVVPEAACSATAVFRVLLVYVASAMGSRAVAAWAVTLGWFDHLSHVWLLHCLRHAGPAFQRVIHHLLQAIPAPTRWLKGWAVLALDATCVHANNARTPTDYERLHLLWNLETGDLHDLHFPLDRLAPESLTHFTLQPHWLVLADRFYCSLVSFHHAQDAGAALVVRWKRTLSLWCEPHTAEAEARWDWQTCAEGLAVGESRSCPVWLGHPRNPRGQLAGRVVMLHVGPEFGANELEKLRKNKASLTPTTQALTPYLVVVTTAPASLSDAELLETFRLRWVGTETEIRQAKSVCGLSGVVGKDSGLRRSWLLGHLCVELLCQAVDRQARQTAVRESFQRVSEVLRADRLQRARLSASVYRLVARALLPIELADWQHLRERFLQALPQRDTRRRRPNAIEAYLRKIEPDFDPRQWRRSEGWDPGHFK